MDSQISYGTYIKNRRKELGLSQYDVSEILLTSTQALSQYENDKVAINLAVLGTFCKVLQVDVKHFITKTSGKDKTLVDTHTFDGEKFASSLVKFRTSRNLSQKELAASLNVTNNKISKWELGNSLPTLEEFLSLIEFYKVDPDEFYFCLIDSFSKPEVQLVKAKTKTQKGKIIFMASAISLAVILGVTLPLAFNSDNNNENNNQGNTPPAPPINEEAIYKVTIVFKNSEIPNKVIEVKEGEKVPSLALKLPLEYQEKYEVIDFLTNGVKFDFDSLIYNDLTIECVLKAKEPVEDIYYKVTFYDVDKITPLGATQKILKGDSALAPDPTLLTRVSGYEFVKWDKDYTVVTSDLDIYPILNAYKTTLHFVSETEKIEDFLNYTHEKFNDLPTSHKEGYIFDGWLLNTNEKFTSETFLEKEMTLYAHFVLKKDYKITIKGFPSVPLIMANYSDEISYDLLPKTLLKNETLLYYTIDDLKIYNNFLFNYSHDIELVPVFKEIIEYQKVSDYSIDIKSFHSANEVVELPKKVLIDGKQYEYTSIKSNVLDLPRAKELIINSEWNTKYFKNFISNAPYLERISFLDSKRNEKNRAIRFENNCLQNITTLKYFEYGIGLNFEGDYYSVMDFGFKINPGFELTLLYKDIFDLSINKKYDFFKEDEILLTKYKNITTINFKMEGDVSFNKNDLSIFPNLKNLNLMNGVTSFKCNAFNDLDIEISSEESVKSIDFIPYKDRLAKSIRFRSKNALKLIGTLCTNELDFSNVNKLLVDENTLLYINQKITFPKEVEYIRNSDEVSLVYNINLDQKVDVYFYNKRPDALQSNTSFKPFKGVNDGIEEDYFNFYII